MLTTPFFAAWLVLMARIPALIIRQVTVAVVGPHLGSSKSLQAFRTLTTITLCAALVGCAGLSRRGNDDVVAARQIASQGMESMRAGDWNQAENQFQEAVTTCDVDERVRSMYAECLWRRGAQTEAIMQMSAAVKLSNRDPALMARLGEMSFARGDLHRAGNLAVQAIGSGQPLASAYRLEGDVLRQEGHWREALASYHQALSIQENYPEVQMAVAEVYYQHGRYQRCLATLQSLSSAYASGQHPADLLYLEGLACKSLRRHNLAATRLADAERQGLQTPTLLFHLAESYYLAGNSAEAQLVVQRALQLQPNHAESLQLAALISSSQQRMARNENAPRKS
jgi:Flp pilus assembly protein TadD